MERGEMIEIPLYIVWGCGGFCWGAVLTAAFFVGLGWWMYQANKRKKGQVERGDEDGIG